MTPEENTAFNDWALDNPIPSITYFDGSFRATLDTVSVQVLATLPLRELFVIRALLEVSGITVNAAIREKNKGSNQ